MHWNTYPVPELLTKVQRKGAEVLVDGSAHSRIPEDVELESVQIVVPPKMIGIHLWGLLDFLALRGARVLNPVLETGEKENSPYSGAVEILVRKRVPLTQEQLLG